MGRAPAPKIKDGRGGGNQNSKVLSDSVSVALWCCDMLQLPKLEVLAARPDLFARSVSSKPIIRLQAPSVVTFTHQHQRKYERSLCVQCVGNILVKVPDTHFKNICWVARAQTCGGTWSYMLAVLFSTHQILMF